MIDFAGYTYDDNKASFVCTHVGEGFPILLFVHDPEGDIHFMCGAEGHGANDIDVVCLSHLTEQIRSMDQMPTVDPGFMAERTHAGSRWAVEAVPEEG